MTRINQRCENCDSVYKLIYEEDLVPDEPKFCAICGAFILEYDAESEDDEDE
ncbi:hypothetical protein KBD45_07730 [Candidatus Dojkabacteria bacterium]|nr:hypothetical protein [Candidatus Dojkabacteria bacterium]